uniref:Calcineurin-like phosphoesterase domain-containing protein n=1 Tax=Moniliophthora roreri TaxID=221103 RepID=A0A0W0FQK1_MONRR
MMRISYGILLAFAVGAYGCGGEKHDHHHGKPKRPLLTPPTRPLEWGDINFIHTTDSHGWLLGHQKESFPEPNYSADLGDFASFVAHMKEIALEKDVDLLLVDSGDLHDGTGLSDGFPPGGIDGQESNEFLKQLPYDVMAIGNHELYIYNITLDMHQNFAPALDGRYLSSNVNITVVDENNNAVSVPVGNRFAKFTTRKGRSVTAFGVLFEFTSNDENTTVQKVADMVKESWFVDAIQDEPDIFLLVGHMPVARDKWPIVHDAIRAVHPTTPILIFGGHTHIRDCLQLDGRSMSLESGRYMETVGWLSAKLETDETKNITFSRRYLDTNRVTYEFHSGKSNTSFDTDAGDSIRRGLYDLSDRFNLDFLFGTAPQDYLLNRAPYPSNNSLLSLFAEQAVPTALAINNSRADIPNYIIIQAGSQRFDLFAGPFTKNDQLTSSPFTNAFVYIPDVPLSLAQQVLPTLNNPTGAQRRSLEDDLYARGEIEMRYRAWLQDMNLRHDGAVRRAANNLTLGYITTDACPGVGDDIPHAPMEVFPLPNYIASRPPNVTEDAAVDFVFSDFVQSNVLDALNSLQSDRQYTDADVSSYSPFLFNAVLGLFAQQAWN